MRLRAKQCSRDNQRKTEDGHRDSKQWSSHRRTSIILNMYLNTHVQLDNTAWPAMLARCSDCQNKTHHCQNRHPQPDWQLPNSCQAILRFYGYAFVRPCVLAFEILHHKLVEFDPRYARSGFIASVTHLAYSLGTRLRFIKNIDRSGRFPFRAEFWLWKCIVVISVVAGMLRQTDRHICHGYWLASEIRTPFESFHPNSCTPSPCPSMHPPSYSRMLCGYGFVLDKSLRIYTFRLQRNAVFLCWEDAVSRVLVFITIMTTNGAYQGLFNDTVVLCLFERSEENMSSRFRSKVKRTKKLDYCHYELR